MFKYIKFLAPILCIIGCSEANNEPVQIAFSNDGAKIYISKINDVALYQLKRNIATDSAYQNLVAVLQTPAEDDSTTMEKEISGKLAMQGDSLTFIPDTPFVKGKSYMVETIINTQFAGAKDILTSKVGHKLKKQQVFLKR
ncbi:MAG: hypothetical protein EOO42_20770 [Flavobacteriales bacterium]|nr:MAG: hypothetical protein EOO42_20770 [Flavobacteriales bacterium]